MKSENGTTSDNKNESQFKLSFVSSSMKTKDGNLTLTFSKVRNCYLMLALNIGKNSHYILYML